jgi:ferredoxin
VAWQIRRLGQGEAPSVFGFDRDADVVTLLDERPDESLRPQVSTAVKYCPAFALSIEETADE